MDTIQKKNIHKGLKKMKKNIIFVFLLFVLTAGISFSEKSVFNGCNYPYKSAKMDKFIIDSYNNTNSMDYKQFYKWMDDKFTQWLKENKKKLPVNLMDKSNFTEFCSASKRELQAVKDNKKKEKAIINLCQWLHKYIKKIIPVFSLQRGYEFSNVVLFGERQCYLQSVLIASILQYMGIDAGVVMVNKNEKGVESNNGHAVTLVKISKDKLIVVDASEPYPFAIHQGLFLKRDGNYIYLVPNYNTDKIIKDFNTYNNKKVSNREVSCLNEDFLNSQFYVYRGEWVDGALHDNKKSAVGIKKANNYFKKAVEICSENTLALYFYARSFEEMGEKENAVKYFDKAYKCCVKYGFVPPNLKTKIKLIGE